MSLEGLTNFKDRERAAEALFFNKQDEKALPWGNFKFAWTDSS
jgi:hypothetical protein